MIEQRVWDGPTAALWQFCESNSHRLLDRVEELSLSVDRIREIPVNELSEFFSAHSHTRICFTKSFTLGIMQ